MAPAPNMLAVQALPVEFQDLQWCPDVSRYWLASGATLYVSTVLPAGLRPFDGGPGQESLHEPQRCKGMFFAIPLAKVKLIVLSGAFFCPFQ